MSRSNVLQLHLPYGWFGTSAPCSGALSPRQVLTTPSPAVEAMMPAAVAASERHTEPDAPSDVEIGRS